MTAETLLIGNLSVRNGDELTRGGSIASSSTSSNSTRSKGSKHRPNVLTSGKNRVEAYDSEEVLRFSVSASTFAPLIIALGFISSMIGLGL